MRSHGKLAPASVRHMHIYRVNRRVGQVATIELEICTSPRLQNRTRTDLSVHIELLNTKGSCAKL